MSSFHKPTQIELFPSPEEKPASGRRSRVFFCRLTLSTESVVILAIAIIILMVVSFSLGIEKGRRLVKGAAAKRPALAAEPVARGLAAVAPAAAAEPEPAPAAAPVAEAPPARPDAEAPAPASETGPKKDVDNFYTVQVASFRTEKYAREEAMKLKGQGYDTLVVEKGKHSIVCVGKYSVEEEAKVASRQLRKTYKDCLIRRM
jgi:cell division septation protein DedD